MSVTYDYYQEETSFILEKEESGGNTILHSEPAPFAYTVISGPKTVSKTLSEGVYLFKISDTYGDGICCDYSPNGSYVLKADGSQFASGGQFSASETVKFQVASDGSVAVLS